MTFTFVDLFAGIGGFHAALSQMGGECVFASEIDDRARMIYEANWGASVRPRRNRPCVEGNIIPLTIPRVRVPRHDVLVAGFPCQPFSKSGRQRGMDEARGTLFENILKVIAARRPYIVMLENVRNLVGPRHRHEWAVIIRSLRDCGYRVSDEPALFSPHLLPPAQGGTPQNRERVFITATRVGPKRAWRETDVEPVVTPQPVPGWNPGDWRIEAFLESEEDVDKRYALTADEVAIIDMWDDLVSRLRSADPNSRLPGFPLWSDDFRVTPRIPRDAPDWKVDFIKKNSAFYRANRSLVDAWRRDNPLLKSLPASRRKLEWQAQEATSLWDTVIHFRPSGVRAKAATYVPALVAITQTSIVGSRRRRLTPRECARLQGFADDFEFLGQPDAATYRQLGNAVCVGVVRHVLRRHVELNFSDLPTHLQLVGRQSEPSRRLRLA